MIPLPCNCDALGKYLKFIGYQFFILLIYAPKVYKKMLLFQKINSFYTIIYSVRVSPCTDCLQPGCLVGYPWLPRFQLLLQILCLW